MYFIKTKIKIHFYYEKIKQNHLNMLWQYEGIVTLKNCLPKPWVFFIEIKADIINTFMYLAEEKFLITKNWIQLNIENIQNKNKLPETSEERHALFVFPILYSYARISYRTLVYISGALGFMSGTWFFIASSQDTPLWLPGSIGQGFLWSWIQRTLTIGESSWLYVTPGTVTSSQPFYEREWLTSPGI